mmetsp:Transcript_17807/g.26989  ORF Transcript_17807/g.26989 Transcript_17807/m.26989 type:complete len:303 (+) Transcript_17807:37-945(+)
MNNRLGELPVFDDEPSDDKEDDIEEGKNKPVEKQDLDKEIFFAAVDQIKKQISHVRKATSKVIKVSEKAKKATTTEQEQKLSKDLRRVIDESNKQAKRAKNLLGELKDENNLLKTQGKVSESDMRVRENLVTTLTRKFLEEIKKYQAAQQQYKEEIQTKLKRQVKLVKPDATDDDVEAIVNSEGGRDALYKQTILAGGVNDDIRNTTAKIAGKYQDMKTLEQSVSELHQMFLDFSLLVENQGELLNSIEHQVRHSVQYVGEANKDVHTSVEIQKSLRKKKCWMIIILICITVGVLFFTGAIP